MENNELLQITGTIEEIIFRNDSNDYTVLTLCVEAEEDSKLITATGVMPSLEPGIEVRMFGYYKSHPTYGVQFTVQAFEQTIPTSVHGILKYLSSGAVRGIGAATASHLVKEFGENTLEVLEKEPERAALLKGISLEKAKGISEQLKQNIGVRELMIYLNGFNIPAGTSAAVFKRMGGKSLDFIMENPYILCNCGINISFETADMIAKKQGKPIDNPFRIRAGVIYVLNYNRANGHTCLPKDRLAETAAGLLEVDPALVSEIMEDMVFDRSVISELFEKREFIFLPELHKAEKYIAAGLELLQSFPAASYSNIDELITETEKEENVTYAEKQREAIQMAMQRGFLILTGGPGTGKTTTLNVIIKLLEKNGQKVLLTAPTGRASRRMSEVTGKEAKTIHRLLEVAFDGEDTQIFKRNEKNQLKCDALIVDEVSMVDSQLFAGLIEALPLGTRLILVGDSHQLPSVGPGNVLDDLISSGKLPCVELTEIFRQSMKSMIVTNAHAIVEGNLPDISSVNSDFFFITRRNQYDLTELVLDLYTRRLVKAYGYSPIDDIQILCPGRKDIMGAQELNRKLQQAVNPPSKDKQELKFGEKILRIGDKVMQYRNNYDIEYVKENGESGMGIFNGDIGIIKSINTKQKTLVIQFDDRVAEYDREQAMDIELSYATTIHKSQGNEFEAVIIPLYSTPKPLRYRNLIYTGVTRAKKLLIMAGDSSILAQMVYNNKNILRYTGLKYFMSATKLDC